MSTAQRLRFYNALRSIGCNPARAWSIAFQTFAH